MEPSLRSGNCFDLESKFQAQQEEKLKMASMCRSAALAAVRASSLRSQILLPKASPSRLASPLFCRSLASALGTVDSLRPLHNAVASARLISNIAVDSSCWSWPSQGTVAMVIFQSV
ncbi:hypothetical protein M5K25_008981 [Dendrobium thyrsiflorum]|uniref:Uncharacterized protein n=1 Tax=Dendrobium thyrsiflorum TaxID=117978 RepID=A0ABD0VH02_DENTH